jgi:class 3 adenylate cyclase
MPTPSSPGNGYLSQLRLLIEEVCCDLCRFEYVHKEGLAPEAVCINREYHLGVPGAYADIRVAAPGQPPYFVEVKNGYAGPTLLQHLQRKYGADTPALRGVSKLVLVIDREGRPDWAELEQRLMGCLRPGLELELWDEHRLLGMIRAEFGIEAEGLTEANLLDVRQAIDRAKGYHAFGAPSLAAYQDDPLKSTLLWHFSFWRLRQMREAGGLSPRDIFAPGLYPEVVVLIADLCSFSSFVRDTRDDAVIRHSLTSFYSKAGYQLLNNGGMLSQFVGDEVVGLFGIPERRPEAVRNALLVAKSLVDIGNSISNEWQRHIDRVQDCGGLHIGMAVGDIQALSLRPFSRTHMGVIGDPLNVAARLMAAAGPSEIIVSNSLYHDLDDANREGFQEVAPLEARNVGRIKAWKLSLASDS